MNVRFPPKVAGLKLSELAHLKDIYNRLVDGLSTRSARYTSEGLTEDELREILFLLGPTNNVALEPINTNMGLSVGFRLLHITPAVDLAGATATPLVLLVFLERQLPEGWDFTRLVPYFTDPTNVKLVVSTGREAPANNYGRYDY